ncbi:PaaI family thioesterase [Frankia canadensis]|nr:PaaI family thioesterase [Frankia canadensis]
MRLLQDRITAAVPDAAMVAEVTRGLTAIADRLEPTARDEWSQLAGSLREVPGRGSALLPVVEILSENETTLRGRVRFSRFHLGGNGAAHGGTIPLMFDDILGRLANSGGRPVARTAYLHVNYRSITPIDRDLRVEIRFDREEGRKRLLRGELRDGDVLCADCEGLFVELRPGQP